jgi:hypothetical protein
MDVDDIGFILSLSRKIFCGSVIIESQNVLLGAGPKRNMRQCGQPAKGTKCTRWVMKQQRTSGVMNRNKNLLEASAPRKANSSRTRLVRVEL